MPIASSPFGSQANSGFSHLSPSYMMLMRNIIPNGKEKSFKAYLQSRLIKIVQGYYFDGIQSDSESH